MSFRIFQGDCNQVIDQFRDKSIDAVFTSPDPPKNNEDVMFLINFFRKFKRCLSDMGTVWINLRNYYYDNSGLLPFNEFFVVAMRQEGWNWTDEVIWYRFPHDKSKMKKENSLRFYVDVEHIYAFAHDRNSRYFNDRLGLHMTSVITAPTEKVRPNEFKSGFPEKVIEVCLKTTCSPHGCTVLDPFAGSGTTGVVALKSGYHFIGIEKHTENNYIEKIKQRLSKFGREED